MRIVRMRDSYLSEGAERPDPTPVEKVIKKPRLGLNERIAAAIQAERLRARAEAEGYETFEEADDFDIDDEEPWPETIYERDLAPDPSAPDDPVPASQPDTEGSGSGEVTEGDQPSEAAPAAPPPDPDVT